MMYKIRFRRVVNSGVAGLIEFDAEIDRREKTYRYRFTPYDSFLSEYSGGVWGEERRINEADLARLLPRGFGWDYGKFMLAATFWEAGYTARGWE